jgi:type IV pilus assembly protein PilE
MIVVAIIAILAMVAYPIYNEQSRKGRRTEAKEAIAKLALGEEKWRINNAAYSTILSQVGGTCSTAGCTDTTVNGYYTVVASIATSGTCPSGPTKTTGNNYTITATAAGQQASDTKCATMSLTNNCGAITKSSTPSGNECW